MEVRHQLGEAEGGAEVDELGKPVLEVVHPPARRDTCPQPGGVRAAKGRTQAGVCVGGEPPALNSTKSRILCNLD